MRPVFDVALLANSGDSEHSEHSAHSGGGNVAATGTFTHVRYFTISILPLHVNVDGYVMVVVVVVELAGVPSNVLPTFLFQHSFITLSTLFQHSFNTLSTHFQHSFNTLTLSNLVTALLQVSSRLMNHQQEDATSSSAEPAEPAVQNSIEAPGVAVYH